MGSELKPCPFCGGEVRIVHNEPYTLGAIVCDTCKALVMFPWYKTESQLDLKEEWDKRAEPEMQTLPVHIKVYSDNTPDEVAEKIYQICDANKLHEVIKALKEICEAQGIKLEDSPEKIPEKRIKRLAEHIEYILDDVYNTGRLLQDFDYEAIFKCTRELGGKSFYHREPPKEV